MDDLRVETLAEFSELLRERYFTRQRGAWIFRGQSDRSWPLIPSVGRLIHTSRSREKLERSLLDMFKRDARPFIRTVPTNEWEWLALAQHHGLPTRLLDWTSNPLVALYFCVEGRDASDGSVTSLMATRKTPVRLVDQEDPLSFRQVTKFMPSKVTQRLVAQEGMFTMQPDVEQCLSTQLRQGWRYESILVPATAKEALRYELFRHGMHRGVLFPGLDGIASNLRWQHTVGPFDEDA
jgi:hypothetical protein